MRRKENLPGKKHENVYHVRYTTTLLTNGNNKFATSSTTWKNRMRLTYLTCREGSKGTQDVPQRSQLHSSTEMEDPVHQWQNRTHE